MSVFYSSAGNPEIWAQKPDGYLTPDEWAAAHPASAPVPPTEAELFQRLRTERDFRLATTDYLLMPDYPLDATLKENVQAYRQALRDLPSNDGAPWDGGGEETPWPQLPSVYKSNVTNEAEPERLRRFWLRMAAVLLVLLVLGSAFVISSHEEIEQWEYPRKYSDLVEYYAGKYSLDEKMLYAVIRTESNFDPNAQSSVDARGLMQITEITFDWIKSNIAPGEELTFDDLYDPETNIRFGSYFFTAKQAKRRSSSSA